jgi:hypothetical protein
MFRNPSTYSRESILDLDFSTWETEKVDTITFWFLFLKLKREILQNEEIKAGAKKKVVFKYLKEKSAGNIWWRD